MRVETLLHARTAGQDDVAIRRSVNCFLGKSDGFRGRPALRIGLLSHDPDMFPGVPPRVALTLSGHTHGGQVAIPLLRRPKTNWSAHLAEATELSGVIR